MTYYDYPEEKIGIFENSDKNYFIKGMEFTYLCTYDEIKKIDLSDAFSGFVLVVYKRYAVIKNGEIQYRNTNFSDGHIASSRCKSNGYVIISNKPKDYFIQSWNDTYQSYELSDDTKYNRALNPIIYETVEEALSVAIDLSKKSDEKFVIAQYFDKFDRYLGY